MAVVETKILGIQGEGSGRDMIHYGDDKARVADLDAGVLWPITNIDSIVKGGYWEEYEHDEELLKTLLELPEAK